MTKKEFIELFNALEECERLMKLINYHDGVAIIINLKSKLIMDYYSNLGD